MIYIPNLLLVGGSQRNVGKTTLIIELIKRYKSDYPLIGLKVTSIYPDDGHFHGKHKPLVSEAELFEETDLSGQKDTSRMLLAGASKVFYIQAEDEHILQTFEKFSKQIPSGSFILCESISLRKHIQPGLFILIKSVDNKVQKQSYLDVEHLADRILVSDGKSFDFDINRISIDSGNWKLK